VEIAVGQEKFREVSLHLQSNTRHALKEEQLFQLLKIQIVKIKKKLSVQFQVYLIVVLQIQDLLMKFINQNAFVTPQS
jgi:hypothetical protein